MSSEATNIIPLNSILYRGADVANPDIGQFAVELNMVIDLIRSTVASHHTREFALKLCAKSQEVADVYSDLCQTVFGLGYPFYLPFTDLPEKFHIEEFERFAQATIDQAQNHETKRWVCPGCQLRGNLCGDFKTLCNFCRQSHFRPRDLFKVLPDLDICLVASDAGAHLPEIARRANANSLITSDKFLLTALDPSTLPVFVDLHVLDANEYAHAWQELKSRIKAVLKDKTPAPLIDYDPIQLPMYSFRGGDTWDVRERLPFDFDMLCTSTPFKWADATLAQLLFDFMQDEKLYLACIEALAKKYSRKEERMLASTNDRNLLVSSIAARRDTFNHFL